jgi:hypothetical protein
MIGDMNGNRARHSLEACPRESGERESRSTLDSGACPVLDREVSPE